MVELRFPLDPSARPEGLAGQDWAAALSRGATLEARVVQVLASSRFLIELLGARLEIESALPLLEGQVLRAEVEHDEQELRIRLRPEERGTRRAEAPPEPPPATERSSLLGRIGRASASEAGRVAEAMLRHGLPQTSAFFDALQAALQQAPPARGSEALEAAAFLARHGALPSSRLLASLTEALQSPVPSPDGTIPLPRAFLQALSIRLPETRISTPDEGERVLSSFGAGSHDFPILPLRGSISAEEVARVIESMLRGDLGNLSERLRRVLGTQLAGSQTLRRVDILQERLAALGKPSAAGRGLSAEPPQQVVRVWEELLQFVRAPRERGEVPAEQLLQRVEKLPREQQLELVRRLCALERELVQTHLRDGLPTVREGDVMLDRLALLRFTNYAAHVMGRELLQVLFPIHAEGQARWVWMTVQRRKGRGRSKGEESRQVRLAVQLSSLGKVGVEVTLRKQTAAVRFRVRDARVKAHVAAGEKELQEAFHRMGFELRMKVSSRRKGEVSQFELPLPAGGSLGQVDLQA